MPDNYAEGNRYLYLNTPLGPDKLILLTFNGFESMSEMYRFQLEVAAKKDEDVQFDQLIGKAVSFGVKATDDNDPRHFDGICIEFSESTRDAEFKYYSIVVVPKLWMTTQRRTCKIFQQKSVHDILTTVLTGLDTDFKLQGTYEPREFCVQYNETDFDFASRLMEEEGIFYFFKFAEDSHTLVIADTPQGHLDVPGATTYTFDTSGGGNRFQDEERVGTWRRSQSWSTAKYTLWDHNFQLTDKHLDADKTINPETVAAGTRTHKLKLNGNDAFEIFEYPGNYAKRFDGISSSGGEQASELNKIFSDNTRTVGIRMKQIATPDVLFTGSGNCRRFTSGHKFTLAEHFDGDGQYVLTSVTHTATEGDFRAGSDINVEHYENSFTAIPMALPYVPSRKTPRPRVFGCQTAKVVGPSGEEIFTDKYGRVKVQFRWDREGQENASSSCWLRVATPWAGKNWGMIHIPRIGQEVIVDFFEGDPDRPVIVGAVYNPDQMPPYKLPDNKTQSGLQTRSSKGGGAANFNEIKFEDLSGSEMLWVHAEKDMDTHVEHDDTQWVENDQTIKVDNNRTETIKGVEKVNVKGDRHNKLEGNHFEEYGQGHSLKIGQSRNVKVGMNDGVDAAMCISLKAGVNIVLEASVGITLKAGASSITISPAGIMISGSPLCLINTAAVALPGVPVVCIPPIIIPPVPPIPPIPGMSSSGGGPSGPHTAAPLPSIASLPPLPPVPDIGGLVGQVGSVLNAAVDSASQLVSGISNQLMDQVSNVGKQTLNQAEQAGQATKEGVADVNKKIDSAVNDAKKQIQDSVADAKKQVESSVNQVEQDAQKQLENTANKVKDLQTQAAQEMQNIQQQTQQAANQAEQMAQQAAQQGNAALAQAAKQAQNAAQQAQQLANQAEQQLQQVAAQAEKTANDAKNQGQQELNAASQQLSNEAKQAMDNVKQVQQQVQNASQQTQQMAQQAMQQGDQALSQAAQQAQQAATQAEQQAKQATNEAEQAAKLAAQQADKQAEAAVKSVETAGQQAGQQVQDAAKQGEQQISNATQQATQQAQQEGKMAESAAQNVNKQVSNMASNASNQVGDAGKQAFGQVGTATGQAVKGVQNALGGLGK